MIDVFCLICWLAEWALFAFKYRALRRAPREHKPLIRPVCAAGFLTGGAFLFNCPVVGIHLDRLTGIPNLSTLIAYSFAVAMVCSLRVMLLLWRYPPERLWRAIYRPLLAYGLAMVAIVVLFFMGSGVDEHHMDFVAAFDRTPYLVELLVIYLVAMIYGLTTVAVLYWVWTKTTPPDQTWLRLGLRVTAAALPFPIAYAMINLVAVVGSWFGADMDYWSVIVSPFVAGSGVPVAVIGLTIAAWGPRLISGRARVARYWADLRDYRQLYPLWNILTSVDPAMIHRASSWGERLSLESRLFWRVIEINDWLHQLRAYLDPAIARGVAHRAHELDVTGDDVFAAVEAAQIVAAVSARSKGQKIACDAAEVDQRETPGQTKHAFGDERARLVKVARFLGTPLTSNAATGAGAHGKEVWNPAHS